MRRSLGGTGIPSTSFDLSWVETTALLLIMFKDTGLLDARVQLETIYAAIDLESCRGICRSTDQTTLN